MLNFQDDLIKLFDFMGSSSVRFKLFQTTAGIQVLIFICVCERIASVLQGLITVNKDRSCISQGYMSMHSVKCDILHDKGTQLSSAHMTKPLLSSMCLTNTVSK